jgi:hypothetical protein
MSNLNWVKTGFKATGSFIVDDKLSPIETADGFTIGEFGKPDGTIYRIVVALEVEKPDGTEKYIISEKEMKKHGFDCLDYDELYFHRD